jgi:glycerol kinase
MEFQANLSNLTVERPAELESTARGAAMLAGLGVGLFRTPEEAAKMSKAAGVFRASLDAKARDRLRAEWADAVRRARSA